MGIEGRRLICLKGRPSLLIDDDLLRAWTVNSALESSSNPSVSAARTCWRATTTSSVLLSLTGVIFFGSLLAGFCHPWSVLAVTEPSAPNPSVSTRKESAAARNDYVGSVACARCHVEIYHSFVRTRMGRSLTELTPKVIRDLPVPATFDSETLDRHFEVFSNGGKLFQSEAAAGANGAEIFRDVRPIGWIIGAGANGFGALLQRGNYLFEAPLSYYTKTQKWEPSPGYEAKDIGFGRTIQAGCVACHSGRAYPTDQNTGGTRRHPSARLRLDARTAMDPERGICARSDGAGRSQMDRRL